MSAATWTGRCTGCHREGLGVASSRAHFERVLCEMCAARPNRMPRADDDSPPAPSRGRLASNGQRPDRYAGRIIDVGALLAQPDEPIPWRCDGLAADGYLSVLAGKGGEGKSWLALAMACGVARGVPAAGIDCEQGRALIFDAENGPKLIGRRLRAATVTTGLAVQPVDAGGLSFAKDLDWFRDTIAATRANLVVFDSLRVLSSGARSPTLTRWSPSSRA